MFTLRVEVDEGVLGIASEFQSLSPLLPAPHMCHGCENGPQIQPCHFHALRSEQITRLDPYLFPPLKIRRTMLH